MADEATTAEPRDGEQAQPVDTATPPSSEQGAGSKQAVLADLAAERDKRQALEQQFTAFRDGLASALGMNQQEATPEQLADQLSTAQRDAAQARIELAVFRSTPDGVDAQALLDSRAFVSALGSIAPGDDAALQAAIDSFVEANPRFRTAPLRSPGGRDAAAGGPSPTPRTMDDLLRGRQ